MITPFSPRAALRKLGSLRPSLHLLRGVFPHRPQASRLGMPGLLSILLADRLHPRRLRSRRAAEMMMSTILSIMLLLKLGCLLPLFLPVAAQRYLPHFRRP